MANKLHYEPRLLVEYKRNIRSKMKEKFSYKNEMQIPYLEKIVLNIGSGKECVKDSKKIIEVQKDLTLIAGQSAVITRANKSIAGFRVREGMPAGAKVTLRSRKMYEFLDRLIIIAMPRIRDFRGLPENSFDGNGNYSFGLKEHIIFPEIDFDKTNEIWGMNVIIVTSTNVDSEAKALLKEFNIPFYNRKIRKG